MLFAGAHCLQQATDLAGIFQKSTPTKPTPGACARAGLDQTALGRDWLAAADRALRDSLVVTLPFQETGFFRADQARRGRLIATPCVRAKRCASA